MTLKRWLSLLLILAKMIYLNGSCWKIFVKAANAKRAPNLHTKPRFRPSEARSCQRYIDCDGGVGVEKDERMHRWDALSGIFRNFQDFRISSNFQEFWIRTSIELMASPLFPYLGTIFSWYVPAAGRCLWYQRCYCLSVDFTGSRAVCSRGNAARSRCTRTMQRLLT